MKKINLIVILSIFMQSAYGVMHEAQNIQEQNQPDTGVPQLIETSNLDTSDYIWKVKVDIDLKLQKINTLLLNPNEKFDQLNKRASEIAAEYVMKSEQKNIIKMKPIIIAVIFPLGPKWLKPPVLTKSSSHMSLMCEFNPKLITWVNPTLYNEKTNSFQLNIALLADHNGNIIKIKNLNQSRLTKLNHYIDQEILKGRLYPFNYDGIPSEIKIMQPFEVKCK